MSEIIDKEIESIERQIKELNDSIREFVSYMDAKGNVSYHRFIGFGQEGQRLCYKLTELKELKEKYCI